MLHFFVDHVFLAMVDVHTTGHCDRGQGVLLRHTYHQDANPLNLLFAGKCTTIYVQYTYNTRVQYITCRK